MVMTAGDRIIRRQILKSVIISLLGEKTKWVQTRVNWQHRHLEKGSVKKRTVSTAGVKGKSVLKERSYHKHCRKIREAYKVGMEKPY